MGECVSIFELSYRCIKDAAIRCYKHVDIEPEEERLVAYILAILPYTT